MVGVRRQGVFDRALLGLRDNLTCTNIARRLYYSQIAEFDVTFVSAFKQMAPQTLYNLPE